MSDTSKLMLSAGEMQLVNNKEWILTKRIIIDKVNMLLGDLSVKFQQLVLNEQDLPPAVIASAPKIAKGENYQQLPYVLLDYPRCFDKENVFAVRTMFWWGNFFSCTLHLSGAYKTMFQHAILKNLATLHNTTLYICVNEEEWEHHFETKNYIAVEKLSIVEITAIVNKQHFIKIAAKFSLHQWSVMEELLEKSFSDALHLLKY